MKLKLLICSMLLFIVINVRSQDHKDYYDVIKAVGEEPASFIANKLITYDLIIFDDALHSAVEPFEFYVDYLKQNPGSVDYVFLEVIPITAQKYIDSFMNNATKDIAILAKVFQQNFRYGWPYETYLTLFSSIWDINQQLSSEEKIKVIGVDQPIYWEGIHNQEDYNTFKQTLIARDNFMYNTILGHIDKFRSGVKGIFLTNTRHAYKCIKNKEGEIYWNAGTFFHQWHANRTYSVRFHNMILNIESVKRDAKNTSMEGLDRLVYKWARMDDGQWDKAFAENGNKPVAIPFENNIFGKHPYLGNHMANVLPGQTMFDANDALIFLKPLEETKFSARTNFFYTDEFKKEVEHRVHVIQEHDLDNFLKENNVNSVREYVEELATYIPEKPNPLIK
ncbi:hypothetical protein QQ008_14940 [Fulvivirgaceae bacterium BMA10]|uniref:Haem-binding uptake Tiki superfamily ChaN domain-containing protein n=1 Tax=Splendidivirga corallicola TaxID=3051826 RepID=A0ABT8KSR5_9BACT|nr:hypothetical protein [Fulvivirgaceae bacterium BMA10]